MSTQDKRNTVTNDAVSDLTGGTTAAWIDDNPVGRCTSSHRISGPEGDISVRCDGQSGHGGDRHQAQAHGVLVYWRDDPASRADESQPNGDAARQATVRKQERSVGTDWAYAGRWPPDPDVSTRRVPRGAMVVLDAPYAHHQSDLAAADRTRPASHRGHLAVPLSRRILASRSGHHGRNRLGGIPGQEHPGLPAARVGGVRGGAQRVRPGGAAAGARTHHHRSRSARSSTPSGTIAS